MLDVAIIGAGFSGIGAAIQLLKRGTTNFRVFDKASGVGGTWYHTRYPGAACDISSHLYCYSFEPNPNWSRVYSPQQEIREYIEHCVRKFDVSSHLQLATEIASIEFDDASSRWQIHFANGESVWARHVIAATGGLHYPKLPELNGMDQFQGPTMHTSQWDSSIDMEGKNVAIIGSAASAVQIVPEVAKIARRLTVFQRTPNWILPRDDRDYSQKEKSRFAHLPWLQQLYRYYIFIRSELVNYRVVKTKDDTFFRRKAEAMAKAYVHSAVKDSALQEQLIPDYPLGCKRVLLSDDFYQSLNDEHVTLTTSAINRMTPDGIDTEDGVHHAADVIIYATGYDLDVWFDRISIIGQGGKSLKERWKALPTAYRGVCVPDFPNFYLVTGPNTGVGSTSILYLIEAALDLILQCIEKAGDEKLVSVTEQAHLDYNKRIQRDLQKTVWAAGCHSWYKRPNGEIPTLYPYNARTFRREHQQMDPEHFTIAAASHFDS